MSELEPAPLFPQMRQATDITVTYVDQAGGPPMTTNLPLEVAQMMRDAVQPCLHMTFWLNGRQRTTLLDLVELRKRGLPDDYESLKKMFPAIRWSAS